MNAPQQINHPKTTTNYNNNNEQRKCGLGFSVQINVEKETFISSFACIWFDI